MSDEKTGKDQHVSIAVGDLQRLVSDATKVWEIRGSDPYYGPLIRAMELLEDGGAPADMLVHNSFALGRESVIGLRGPWVQIDDDQADLLTQGMIVRLSDGRCVIEGPLDSIGVGPTYYLAGKGLAMENPSVVQVRETDVPKPDPQRLVSVRADDLVRLAAYYEHRAGVYDQARCNRIRAALRGETS